jgi:hypothetical protein
MAVDENSTICVGLSINLLILKGAILNRDLSLQIWSLSLQRVALRAYSTALNGTQRYETRPSC